MLRISPPGKIGLEAKRPLPFVAVCLEYTLLLPAMAYPPSMSFSSASACVLVVLISGEVPPRTVGRLVSKRYGTTTPVLWATWSLIA